MVSHSAAACFLGQGLPCSSRASPLAAPVVSGRLHILTPMFSTKQRQVSRERLAMCRSTSSSTAVTSPAAAAAEPTTDAWATFAAAVSGEWEGITASFNPDGSPIQLPEYYVPQAYREWGVELYDWQSQSSMLADGSGLTATNRRMMPTVGCEADAIAFTQEAAQLFAVGPEAASGTPVTVAADGSYSAGPASISAPDCFKAAFEHCLALPLAEEQQQRMRLRVVHNLRRRAAEGEWQLDSVELHSERYDSPYRGKLELSGCGGGMKGFATSEPLAAEALAGSWAVAGGLRYSMDSSSGQWCCTEAAPGEPWAVEGLPEGLLLHPLRCWSACSTSGSGGGSSVSLAAGALLGEGGSRMAVASRQLVGGQVVGVELLTLEKTSA